MADADIIKLSNDLLNRKVPLVVGDPKQVAALKYLDDKNAEPGKSKYNVHLGYEAHIEIDIEVEAEDEDEALELAKDDVSIIVPNGDIADMELESHEVTKL